MTLEVEIKQAIDKALPAMLANQLAERIQQGDEAIKKLKIAENTIKEIKEECAVLRKNENYVTNKTVSLNEKEIELESREKKLFEAEITAKVITEERTKSKDDIFRLVETVFKNPVVRQHSFSSESTNMSVRDAHGCFVQPTRHTSTNTEFEIEGTK